MENIPVNFRPNATHTVSIFGPELAGMHSRMVRSKPDRVEPDGLVPIPRDFYRLHNVGGWGNVCRRDYISDYLI